MAIINFNDSVRAVQSDFTQLSSSVSFGPIQTTAESQNMTTQPQTQQSVAVWTVMDKFDDGLKKALISFIDTTKEGVTFASNPKGREKKITFNFSGNVTKSIIPGEIGEFNLVFSYPPGADLTTDTTTWTRTISS